MQDFVLEKLILYVLDIKSCLGWGIIHSQLFPALATHCLISLIHDSTSWIPSKLPAVLMCDQRN